MLASITPLGERSRRQRWPVTVSALVAGGGAAGAAGGAALAAAGEFLPVADRLRLDLLLALAAAAVVVELLGVHPPTHRRQVDDAWLRRYRGVVYGLGFGAQLGVGVVTTVATSAVYVALLAEALAPTILAGAAIGAAFGLLRGATVLTTAGIDSPPRLAAFHRRFHDAERAVTVAAVAAQAAAVAAVAAMIS